MSVFDEEVTEATGSPLRSQRYVLKLVRLELSDHAQYGPGVRWVFHVADAEGGKDLALIRMADGEPYEFFQITGTRLQAPKPGAKIPKAFKFACAFLGRQIRIGESGSEIARELIGKKAEAFLAPNENGNLAVMSIDPLGTNYPQLRNGAAKPAAPAPAPEPELVAASAPSGNAGDLDF